MSLSWDGHHDWQSEYALCYPGKYMISKVAYARRRLTTAETRYSTLERELLGIMWAIDHFSLYLFGKKFRVTTDHIMSS